MMIRAKRLEGSGEKLLTDIVADYLIAKGHIGQQAGARINEIK
jgi:hypothetical protein